MNFKFKKFALVAGSITTTIAPIATVFSCGADEVIYKVVIDNAKDKNYVLTTQDENYQPVVFVGSFQRYWDMKPPEDKAKLDKFLGGNATQKLITSVKAGKPFSNGLEWLAYDLLQAIDHKKDLTLVLGKHKVKGKEVTNEITISQADLKPGNDAKETANNRLVLFTNPQYTQKFEELFKNTVLVKFENGNYLAQKTDVATFKKAFTDMNAKIQAK